MSTKFRRALRAYGAKENNIAFFYSFSLKNAQIENYEKIRQNGGGGGFVDEMMTIHEINRGGGIC